MVEAGEGGRGGDGVGRRVGSTDEWAHRMACPWLLSLALGERGVWLNRLGGNSVILESNLPISFLEKEEEKQPCMATLAELNMAQKSFHDG